MRGQVIVNPRRRLARPPRELIPDMIEKWRRGYQVVTPAPTNTTRNWFKRFTAYFFYRLLKSALRNVEHSTDTGDFCLMDRQSGGRLLTQCQSIIRYTPV